jgi:ferredoxin-NADP reductase
LLIGNVFAYVVTRDKRLQLAFVKRRKEAEGIYSYLFSGKNRFKYKPGQFMEWTVPTNKTDSRGNRRYFTVSASPTEKNLMLTVRVPEKSSSFKQSLNKLKPGDKMLASRLSGDFVLPKDKSRKLAFIAGGVGITPFRSIIKYLVDSQQPRDIALLYSANSPDELAFMDLFNKAGVLGIKTAYNLTDLKERLPSWDGHTGPIRATMIKHIMPDYKERLFYVSGPYGLVQAVEQELKKLGIPGSQIKLDYFPGYG